MSQKPSHNRKSDAHVVRRVLTQGTWRVNHRRRSCRVRLIIPRLCDSFSVSPAQSENIGLFGATRPRRRVPGPELLGGQPEILRGPGADRVGRDGQAPRLFGPVSYTHLRAHETVLDLVCRLLLEQKKKTK